MKPAVHRILKESRYSSTFIEEFEALTRNAKHRAKRKHIKASRVNKLRLTLLDSLNQGPKSYEALLRRLFACDELRTHTVEYLIFMGVDVDLIYADDWRAVKQALSLPYIHVPPAERAIIYLCSRNGIAMESGDNDFSRICYLVLEEMNDPRAASKARRKAFRQKLIEDRDRWLARFLLSTELGRATLFDRAREILHECDDDTIAKVLNHVAGLK